MCFFLKIYFLNNLSPCKKYFFREKTSFYLLLIFFTISIVFLEKEGGGKSCQFSFVFSHKKKFLFCFSLCFSWQEIHHFPLFNSFFNCHFPVFFSDLATEIRWQMTKHVIKRKEKQMVGNGPPRFKSLLLACF